MWQTNLNPDRQRFPILFYQTLPVRNWSIGGWLLPVVWIGSREVWTLNDPAESSYLRVTNGVVLEPEATSHVTAVRPETDCQHVATCFQYPGTKGSVTESAQTLAGLSSGAIVQLHKVILTTWPRTLSRSLIIELQLLTWAWLHVEIREDHMNPGSLPHQYPPSALGIVMVWLGVVWRADTATWWGQVTATTWKGKFV